MKRLYRECLIHLFNAAAILFLSVGLLNVRIHVDASWGGVMIPDAYDGLIILRIKRPEDARPVYHVVYHESLTPTVVVILPPRKDVRVDLTAEQVNRMVLFEPCEW